MFHSAAATGYPFVGVQAVPAFYEVRMVRGTCEQFAAAGHEVVATGDRSSQTPELFLQIKGDRGQGQYLRMSGHEFDIESYDRFRQNMEAIGLPLQDLYAEGAQAGIKVEPGARMLITTAYHEARKAAPAPGLN